MNKETDQKTNKRPYDEAVKLLNILYARGIVSILFIFGEGVISIT